MYSAYKLNKQGDNIQPWHTPFPIWNRVYCSMSSSNCCFLTCIQVSQVFVRSSIIHWQPTQYSCLENPMDRRTWRATVLRVAKHRTWLSMHHNIALQISLHYPIFMYRTQNLRIFVEILPLILRKKLFYWSIIASHYCVGSWCPTMWINYKFAYIPSLLNLLSTPNPIPLRSSQHQAELSVLYSCFPLDICFMHGSVYMSVLYLILGSRKLGFQWSYIT